jgi:hypothetical protein
VESALRCANAEKKEEVAVSIISGKVRRCFIRLISVDVRIGDSDEV